MIIRTSEQVLGAALERLVRETDITVTSAGGVARTWFEIAAEEIGYDFRLMDANISSLFVSSAGGVALDKLGKLFGVERTSISSEIGASTGKVYFYLNSQANHQLGSSDIDAEAAITIPAGTFLSTQSIGFGQNPITWRTTEDCIIEKDSHLAYASVEPVVTIVNTVARGTLINHDLDPLTYPKVYVYNRADLQAVEEFESDSNYRYRIVNAINYAAKANVFALRLAALSISGVRDCKVRPLAYGVGTAKVVVVLEDVAAPDASTVFSNASTAIREASSVGDVLFIQRPTETRVDITGVAVGSGLTTAITNAVAANIERYINSLSVGDPISHAKIINEAMNTSAQVRDFAIIDGGFKLNGVPRVFTSATANGDEQFYPGDIVIGASSTAPSA